MNPVVVIVGRPNAGKSTLFNRLTGSRDAIVDDAPGVTRDRHYKQIAWNQKDFTLVDTGGFMADSEDPFRDHIRHQINQAVREADAVIMLLDGKNGLSPFDRELLSFLQEGSCPVFYLVNKIDEEKKESEIYEFYQLGIDNLYPVSAANGYGISDFMDELAEHLPTAADEPAGEMIRVAVVGRPNAGKSTLINRILGQERLIVSELPGTTRDSLDTVCEKDGRTFLFIDTAGLRKKSRVREKIEKFSAVKTLKSLERCDIALIMGDALEGISQLDITIAGYAYESGCGCIFLINKWDLARKQGQRPDMLIEDFRYKAKFLGYAPVLPISARTGWNLEKLFAQITAVYEQYCRTISTPAVNSIIQKAVERHQPPMYRGRRLKFNYATQVSKMPPAFVCFVNFAEGVHFSYKRYLINAIRQETGLDRVPINLYFKEKNQRPEYFKKRKKTGPKKSQKRRS